MQAIEENEKLHWQFLQSHRPRRSLRRALTNHPQAVQEFCAPALLGGVCLTWKMSIFLRRWLFTRLLMQNKLLRIQKVAHTFVIDLHIWDLDLVLKAFTRCLSDPSEDLEEDEPSPNKARVDEWMTGVYTRVAPRCTNPKINYIDSPSANRYITFWCCHAAVTFW